MVSAWDFSGGDFAAFRVSFGEGNQFSHLWFETGRSKTGSGIKYLRK